MRPARPVGAPLPGGPYGGLSPALHSHIFGGGLTLGFSRSRG